MSESVKPSRKAPPAATTSPADRADPPHVRHVREHMDRIRSGMTVADPERVFLGPCDADHLWELVGLRIRGHPTVVLAMLRFQRHELPGLEHARESLVAYLTSPPAPVATGGRGARAGEISAYVPRWHESAPGFLARMRDSLEHTPIHLSPDVVEVAFDLRMANPSGLESVKRSSAPMLPHLLRTTAGHVLRGLSHGPDPHSRFMAVTSVEQITPRGRRSLPAVMLHNSFVSLTVPLDDEKTRMAAPNWTPFLPATAANRHLLVG
ncbi:MAG TPA: hypothetical protein VGA70_01990 [Longimicrobiales bacterium]